MITHSQCSRNFTPSLYGTPSLPHSPGLVVLCRLPLLRNGDLCLGFPCPSLLEEEEVEDDILPPVLLLLLEQSESEMCSGQQRERGVLALKLEELRLSVGQRGGRTHTGPAEAPLQSWLLLSARSRSAAALQRDELKRSSRLPWLVLGAILLGCPSNQRKSFL